MACSKGKVFLVRSKVNNSPPCIYSKIKYKYFGSSKLRPTNWTINGWFKTDNILYSEKTWSTCFCFQTRKKYKGAPNDLIGGEEDRGMPGGFAVV